MQGYEAFREELFATPPVWPENLVVAKAVASTQRLALLVGRTLVADEERPRPSAFIAYAQKAGRGRLGRRWASPPGGGIYATCLVDWTEPSRLAELPLRAGVGLAQAAASLLGTPCLLKWPNDLMVDEHKLGGILIESVTHSDGGALAAIGFGVNYSALAELPEGAADLQSLNPRVAPMAACARVLLDGIGAWLDSSLPWDRVVRVARQITAHRPGGKVSFRAGEELIGGEFFGLDESGLLLLRVAGTLRRFSAGEIIES